METVTVSPKHEVVIPLAAREALGTQPGQEIHVMVRENRIACIPGRVAKRMRGLLKRLPNVKFRPKSQP